MKPFHLPLQFHSIRYNGIVFDMYNKPDWWLSLYPATVIAGLHMNLFFKVHIYGMTTTNRVFCFVVFILCIRVQKEKGEKENV